MLTRISNYRSTSKDKKQGQKNKDQSMELQAVSSNSTVTKFHQIVQEPWGDGSQQKLLLSIPLLADPLVRKRYIVVKNVTYHISNWTSDDYPSVIYVCLKNFVGYNRILYTVPNNVFFKKNENFNDLKTQTRVGDSRIAALQLESVSVTLQSSEIRTYDLKYTIKDVVSWQIPLSLMKLDFQVKVDGNLVAQTLPLPNPLLLNVELRQDR